MAIKVFIQSMFWGFMLLILHWFSHAWPIAAKLPEIQALFTGPLVVVYYFLNVLAAPLNYLLGWMWETFSTFNLVGPFAVGFVVTYLRLKKQAKVGVEHVAG
jgi:hypothetical protein